MLLFVCIKRPHVEYVSNFLQIFNDGCLMAVAVLLFPFYYLDPYGTEKFIVGWIFISIMLLNVAVNIIMAFFMAIKKCIDNRRKKKVELNGDEQTRKETDEQQETNKPIKPTTNFTIEDKKALTKKEMMSNKSKSD